MLKTSSSAFNAKVYPYILNSICEDEENAPLRVVQNSDGLWCAWFGANGPAVHPVSAGHKTAAQAEAGARASYIWARFVAEYDYPANRLRYPNLQERVSQWLAGLALNIAFTYSDIIEISEQWHECKLTEKQADKIIDGWFYFMAFKLIQCCKANGVNVYGSSIHV